MIKKSSCMKGSNLILDYQHITNILVPNCILDDEDKYFGIVLTLITIFTSYKSWVIECGHDDFVLSYFKQLTDLGEMTNRLGCLGWTNTYTSTMVKTTYDGRFFDFVKNV
jgi:hypothetical protein